MFYKFPRLFEILCSAVKLRHDVHVQPYETWHFRWSFDAEIFDSFSLSTTKPILTSPWTTKTVPGPNLVVVVSPLTPQPTLTVENACENLPSKPSTLRKTRTTSKTTWAHSSADSALPSIRTMAPTSRIHKVGSIRQTSLGERLVSRKNRKMV